MKHILWLTLYMLLSIYSWAKAGYGLLMDEWWFDGFWSQPWWLWLGVALWWSIAWRWEYERDSLSSS